MTPAEIDKLLKLPPQWQRKTREQWVRLMDLAVWGDLKCTNVGGITKLRKRVLDFGEKWRSLFNDREWIPQPRERLKNQLGSSLSLRDSLQLLEKAVEDMQNGSDRAEFLALFAALRTEITETLSVHDHAWATALERVNKESIEE